MWNLSGSGPVGRGDGGGRSSKKRGRGLGTIKSEDDMTEDSENAGELHVDEVESMCPETASNEGNEGGRKGCGANGADIGDALRQTRGTGEGGPGLGVAFSALGPMVYGGDGDPSEVIMTAGEEGGVGNIPSDESKRVDGVKRTPNECDIPDAEACSGSCAGDRGYVSGSGGRRTYAVGSQGGA